MQAEAKPQREPEREAEPTPEEKHEVWMKNSSYLYDRLVVHDLKWPSLTFQWLPGYRRTQESVIMEFVIATHTSGKRENEFIQIMEVEMPFLKNMDESEKMQKSETNPAKVKKVQEFSHSAEPNRVRYCEKDPSLLAVRVDDAPIAIYKRGSQFPHSILDEQILSSGFSLEWSRYGLLSGDHGGNIVFWKNIEEKAEKLKYQNQIEDARFVKENIFMSVGDDGKMSTWDIRTGKVESSIQVSEQQLYCMSVNPENDHLILTGGEDTVIKIWDTRNPSSKLYSFDGHEKSVLSLNWSQKTPSIFASGGQDSKVKIWDLLRVGFEIPKDNSGTQELLFTHEGHRGEVMDVAWHPEMMLLGSTEEQFNTVQIYQISNCIQDLEFIEDMDYLRSQCLG